MLLFAHRGVPGVSPENSEAAFDDAWRLGFRGIELDIRRTKDNQLAVFHDRWAQTMLGLRTNFSDLTLAEIRAHGLLVGDKETTNRVPTLRTIFAKYGQTFRFYLDMKEKHFRDADQLIKLIEEYGLEQRTILASVDPMFIIYVEHYYPHINTVLERFDEAQVLLYRLIPRRWKPDFLSGFARKASPSHIEWLKKKQLLYQRIVYDVTEENYSQVVQLGIKKAIVDYAPGVYSAALSPPVSQPSSGPGSAPP